MLLDLDRFDAAPLVTDPFDYVVVRDFLSPAALQAAQADFPRVRDAGVYAPESVRIAGGFAAVMKDLTGEDFRAAVERKFAIGLAAYPSLYTVRGFTRARDGRIHNDSRTKLMTVLLYFNPAPWRGEGGRLRMLRGPDDLEDFADEVAPEGGTLVVFRRSEASWHGHHRFVGPRRAVQLNWVTDRGVVMRESGRHALSATLKRLNPFHA